MEKIKMWYIYIVCAAMAAALIIYIIHYNKEKNSQFKKWKDEYLISLDKEFNNLINAIKTKKTELNSIERDIKSKNEFNDSLKRIREEELNRLISKEKEQKLAQVESDVEDWARSAQEVANENYMLLSDQYNKEIMIKKESLDWVVKKLQDYQKKVDAVNQEILRRRAIDEQQDFYRIQLTENVKDDISILNDIKPKLSNLEIFNKFIYENYISRPTKEMIKRVLEGRNPSGIYKVTNIDTNEIYIGKSVKIADRWQNHIKAAAGLGGVAESQFQRALKKYGIDHFTWEVLEQIDKDNLTERERYYINFYNTKQYGYNQREG